MFGTDIPDYERIFGYAGYKFEKKIDQLPDFGFQMRNRNGGLMNGAIEPGSGAATSGLKVGDVVTKLNGDPPLRANFNSFAGKTITLTVDRAGKETEIPVKIGSRDVTNFLLTPMPNATTRQTKVREGWLKR